ncbi:hypothetical protein HaloA020_04210 [Halomonas sp. A020]|nr:hypothetical protein HaloA020_04210 [Halomonas sp. A020]
MQVAEYVSFITVDKLAIEALVEKDIHNDIPKFLSLKVTVALLYHGAQFELFLCACLGCGAMV